jgi:hypothetical protein
LFDTLIAEGVVCKTLESDNLIFIEGQRDDNRISFVPSKELINDHRDPENWDQVSCGDFDAEFDDKKNEIEERNKTELGWFETSSYFTRLFPTNKLQKPGLDLYAQ